jgi:hypothetical protein
MLLRVVYIIAGLFLAANAVYITFRLIASGSILTLALTAAPLMAGLALGVLLVVKNVKSQPEEEPTVEPKDPEEDSST